MKNTINISLGGIVFHIEEDAHQKLSAYLDAISRSMQGSEGQKEIMADIEARIAELLQPKVSSFKQVITIDDIQEVIGIMGSPEEFSTGTGDTKKEEPINTTGEKGRYQYGYRRIFRDPDDKVVSGVCSGLAYHFGVDPIWLRLAFGISIFIGGFGVLLYILLIILLPKARTAAEKLEMRGQPVDANNIRRIIEEDMRDFKKKAQEFGNEMKDWSSRARNQQFGQNVSSFFSSLGHGAGNLIGGVFKAIFAFIGFILVIVLACMLFALVISLWTGMNVIHIEGHSGHMVDFSMHNVFTMLNIEGGEKLMLMLGLTFFIGIPLLALIIRFARAIMGLRRGPQWMTITFFSAWFVGLILMFTSGMYIAKHFSVKNRVTDEVHFSLPAHSNTLYLNMPNHFEEDEDFITVDSLNVQITDEELFRGSPSVCIGTSPDTNFYFVINKWAHGKDEAEAKAIATNIEYSFAQHDSVLQLSPSYQVTAPWRGQKLEGVLEMPLNKAVAMPEGIDHIICSTVHHKHKHLGGHKWVMTIDGLTEANATNN